MNNNKRKNNQRKLLAVLLLLFAAVIVDFILNIKSEVQAFKQMWQMSTTPHPLSDWLPIFNVLIPIILIIILLWSVPEFRKWVNETIGEGTPTQHNWYRFILPSLLAMPFLFFTLLSGVTKPVPPVIQFSVVAIAPTLGGLVLTAATNNRRRMKKKARIELISVAQKLIVATVVLIVFASLFFTSDLLGGANSNSLERSWAGFFRWAFLWGGVWSFYISIFLFLLGISDLVFALKYLRR